MPEAGMNVGEVHRDQLLTNLARQYRPDRSELIADVVAPRLPVKNESDDYPVFRPRDFFATDVPTLTPDRSPAREIQIGYDYEGYSCHEHALKISISRRERKNADSQIRLEESKNNALGDQLLLQREKRVAAVLRKTTNGGQLTLGGGVSTKWDGEKPTIKKDVKAARKKVRDTIGFRPNTLVIPYPVAEVIVDDPEIGATIEKLLTGQGLRLLEVGELILPRVLWGMRVVVPDTREISSPEGAANEFSDIWSDNVRLLYVNPSPDINRPSVMHTFVSEASRVDRWFANDPPELEYIRQGEILDEKLVAPEAGYEIADVLT